jgi:hypothetical protein
MVDKTPTASHDLIELSWVSAHLHDEHQNWLNVLLSE